MAKDYEKLKDEMIREAFLKIKKENNDLKNQIEKLSKRIENLEKVPIQTLSQPPEIVLEKPSNQNKIIENIKANLTPSEKEILYIFTMSKEKSYTYEELGKLLKKSSHTIKAQIQSIIKKGIMLSFSQNSNGQRSYNLTPELFEMIIRTKN